MGVWTLLVLEKCDLEFGHGVQLRADRVSATWPGRLRIAVRAATFTGPAGATASLPATSWDVAGVSGEDTRLTLVEPQTGLSIRKVMHPRGKWHIEARGLDAPCLLDMQRDGHALLDGGIADGRVDLQAGTDALRFHVDMSTRGARVARVGAEQRAHPRNLSEHHRMGAGHARPAACRPPLFRSRTPRPDTGRYGFLVEIIPAPIKYQSSFAHGSAGPGLVSLIDSLLAKLRSVKAIDETEYRRALEESIVVSSGRPPE